MCNFCPSSWSTHGVLVQATENAFGKFDDDTHDHVKWDYYHKLGRALGYSANEFQYVAWPKALLVQMETLAGPHGRALFKAMQIRKNANARSATR